MSKKVAVILSGCGYLDGSEIREAVLSLLYLDNAGAEVKIFAPDSEQADHVNHLTGEDDGFKANAMVEAARIARGEVAPLSTLQADAFDALVIPGGYGAAKNLSNLASQGVEAELHPDFLRVIKAFFAVQKPIGAICIAPAVLAVALKDSGVLLTIGEDAGTAAIIESLGCKHQKAATDEIVIDEEHNVVSCSAYMRDDALSQVAQGIEKLIHKLLDIA